MIHIALYDGNGMPGMGFLRFNFEPSIPIMAFTGAFGQGIMMNSEKFPSKSEESITYTKLIWSLNVQKNVLMTQTKNLKFKKHPSAQRDASAHT